MILKLNISSTQESRCISTAALGIGLVCYYMEYCSVHHISECFLK